MSIPRNSVARRVRTPFPLGAYGYGHHWLCDADTLREWCEDAGLQVLRLDRVTDSWRVIASEGDGLPGLIVDKFGPVLSCQIASRGIYRAFPAISAALKQELQRKLDVIQTIAATTAALCRTLSKQTASSSTR